MNNTKKKVTLIKKVLRKNEEAIQKSASSIHIKLNGANPIPHKYILKYKNIHIKLVRAIANNLDDFEKGTVYFNKLGVKLAKDAIKDALTIEEAVDGTIFLKQAIWKKFEETILLKELSIQDLYEYSQIIEGYSDVLVSQIAFTYHNILTEKVTSSEVQFRALTEKSSDAIALVDNRGKVLHASLSTKQVTGYTSEEFKELRNPFELVPASERKLVTKLFAKLLKNPGGVERLKYQILHKGGYAIWVESVMTNLLEDPYVRAVVINYSDITARKVADEKLIQSEERFRALLNASSDAVYRMSSDWTEMRELQGRDFLPNTKTPIKNWLKKYVYADDQKSVLAAIEASIRTKNTFQLEYRVKQADGNVGWTFSRAVPIFDEHGKIVEWFGAASDITNQKESQRQKDDFLGIVSHELKTPVTSIKAYGQVLETIFTEKGDTKAAELLEKMDAQVNRLNHLIADLLDITKIHSGRLQFNEDHFDFNELVKEKIEQMQQISEGHTMLMRLGATRKVYGDRERIGQVLINFLSNAIKYSPKTNKIIVTTSSPKQSTMLCVQDFGLGIPQANLKQVFEQFFRVTGPSRETFPGLGLGLYISSEIIKREGGRIWVKSPNGKGSTFCFSLPTEKKGISRLSKVKLHHKI